LHSNLDTHRATKYCIDRCKLIVDRKLETK